MVVAKTGIDRLGIAGFSSGTDECFAFIGVENNDEDREQVLLFGLKDSLGIAGKGWAVFWVKEFREILCTCSGFKTELPARPMATVIEWLELVGITTDGFPECFKRWFGLGGSRSVGRNTSGPITIVEEHILIAEAVCVELVNCDREPIGSADWCSMGLLKMHSETLGNQEGDLVTTW
jgi:hypothetical protein